METNPQARKGRMRINELRRERRQISTRPLWISGYLIGIGLAGWLHGIAAQWMRLAYSAGIARRAGTGLWSASFQDGVVQTVALLALLGGLARLYSAVGARSVPWSIPALAGATLAGMGMFGLAEGVLIQPLLAGRHAFADSQIVWTLAYLAMGVAALLGGLALSRMSAGQRTMESARLDMAA